MSGPASNSRHSKILSAGGLRHELCNLEAIANVIEENLSELHHELRRVGDGLERAGGRSVELEMAAGQLKENIKLGHKDLKFNQARQKMLKKQLLTIEG